MPAFDGGGVRAPAGGDDTGECDIRILVADDDLTSRTMVTTLLRKAGYEVVEAVDGAEAWQRMQQSDAPPLAIIDWMMPAIDGLDVVRRIRSADTAQPPYVILLTARGKKAEIVTGLEAGADDYLPKPFDAGELRARVEVGRRMVEMQAELVLGNRELTRWKERMTRELTVAGRLQSRLLDTTPLLTPRHEVRMCYRPSLNVGGDFFDAFELPDGRLCVYAGDVAGHGVGPALMASLMRAVVSEAARVVADAGIAAIGRVIRNRFREQIHDPEVYATLFLAIHEPQLGVWRGLSCGHPPPILLARDGRDLSGSLALAGGLPIGIDPRFGVNDGCAAQDEVTAPAPPGSVLFLFTDGLLEARERDSGEACGQERLAGALAAVVMDEREGDYPDRVLARIESQGYELSRDDCCAITVRVTNPAELVLDRAVVPTLETTAALAREVEETLRGIGWPEESAAATRLVAHEYGTNVVGHDRLPPGGELTLQMRVIGDTCRLLFRNPGREWDSSARLAAIGHIPEDAERGRGLEIIRAVARHVELFHRGKENVACCVIDRDFVVTMDGASSDYSSAVEGVPHE